MKDVTFAHPELFWLLLVIPAMAAWYALRGRRSLPALTVSSFEGLAESGPGWRARLRHTPFMLRCAATALLIAALARPQTSLSWQDVTTEGIDIVVAIDVSGSMLAKDFKPDRLEVAKQVTAEFIEGRPSDRIGLVVFSGESFTQCPLTTDHAILKNILASVRTGILEDGTAIGMGLANAVNRLRFSEARSKVIILLTDGVNNKGSVAPLTAAELAQAFGIRVYTIGVGSEGMAYSPVGIYPNGQYAFDYVKVEIDEKTLTEIAEMTDGRYFRAGNHRKLEEIYRRIDQMEKSRIEVTEYNSKGEEFFPLALAALLLLLLETVVRTTVLRTVP